ncbi:hypothetical protein [Ectothiorhodospira shaposhnikovii]|uniref:hypothetical protein n=1 Tax=Ectothiorhodospira shaposhnikovii TaxID=1054 RepID=UPI001EE877E9|nr:hypothetical protein [Ectothiorhodospira shaposhnikovii]MCG5514382.1 hypothetical protein [Ectothiorhodospira shaposhnikovii]
MLERNTLPSEENPNAGLLQIQDQAPITPFQVWWVQQQSGLSDESLYELQRRNIDVFLETSITAALKKPGQALEVDCLVLDVSHVEAQAFSLIDQVRAWAHVERKMPPSIIVLSESLDQATLRRIFRKQVDDLLPSPVNGDEIAEAVVRGAGITRLRSHMLPESYLDTAIQINRYFARHDVKASLGEDLPEGNYAEVIKAVEKNADLPVSTYPVVLLRA